MGLRTISNSFFKMLRSMVKIHFGSIGIRIKFGLHLPPSSAYVTYVFLFFISFLQINDASLKFQYESNIYHISSSAHTIYQLYNLRVRCIYFHASANTVHIKKILIPFETIPKPINQPIGWKVRV